MKLRFLIYCLMLVFVSSCSTDPCEELENLECETGDFDKDGIINRLDSNPEDPCLPVDNLTCTTGDVDEDGIINGEDQAPEDPCLPFDNVKCPTGDLDEDGIINSEDIAPNDFCVPIKPLLSEIIIGEWEWHISTRVGTIKFNQDGTFEDLQNELVAYGNVIEKTWNAVSDMLIVVKVKNDEGKGVVLTLETISQKCHLIVFKGFSNGDFIFVKK